MAFLAVVLVAFALVTTFASAVFVFVVTLAAVVLAFDATFAVDFFTADFFADFVALAAVFVTVVFFLDVVAISIFSFVFMPRLIDLGNWCCYLN
jgi:hypothetical protein